VVADQIRSIYLGEFRAEWGFGPATFKRNE
jgi:hypothetical protein